MTSLPEDQGLDELTLTTCLAPDCHRIVGHHGPYCSGQCELVAQISQLCQEAQA